MAGLITPLPIMLEEDRKVYEKLEPPKTMVCRYGYMKQIAELPYSGQAKPGCGSKLVIRTNRGIELAEMLTTTCPNAGCGESVSRKQLLEYIDASGGKDYPFTNQGRVLRIATAEDVLEQSRLDKRKTDVIKFTKDMIRQMDLPMKLVEVEQLLGGERVIFHYTSEQWVDFRELVRRLASEYQTRIEMHQVNARDEARLVADYEKCGQYCCCKQFLKVLKPVSMRSAKVQKATLDPTKISGRCGRLMCCLRYEDQTYESLRKRLPKRQTRVMTEDDGPGTVVDTQILTQLALVRLDSSGKISAYPLENIRVLTKEEDAKLREQAEARAAAAPPVRTKRRPPAPKPVPAAVPVQATNSGPEPEGGRKRRRRRRRGGGRPPQQGDKPTGTGPTGDQGSPS